MLVPRPIAAQQWFMLAMAFESSLACAPDPGMDASSHGPPSTTLGASDTSAATGDVPTGAVPTNSGGDAPATSDPSSTDGHVFIVTPDGGTGSCDLFTQNCPAGQKCNPVNIRHDNVNEGKALCVPLVRAANLPGSPCSVLGDAEDGTDDCALGSVCLFPDDEGIGRCHALCDRSQEDRSCVPAGTQCTSRGCQDCTWGYCDRSCDPRVPDTCEPGRVCIPWWGQQLACGPDASGEAGKAGDACEFANSCDPGLLCTTPEFVPGCIAPSGCCSPFCSTDLPNTCPGEADGEVCKPWFDEGQAPAGLETLGLCTLP